MVIPLNTGPPLPRLLVRLSVYEYKVPLLKLEAGYFGVSSIRDVVSHCTPTLGMSLGDLLINPPIVLCGRG